MSDAVAPVKEHAPEDAGPPLPPLTTYRLDRVRWFGYAILALQLVGLMTWSAVLYDHFAMTWDFATYYQPWYLIAHGNLDPYSTLAHVPFWQNDAEFLPWLISPLYWVFRNAVGLAWLQDLSIVGAEVVVFGWICDVAARWCSARDAQLLAGLGLLLLVANPWIWWTVSFDVHEEPLVIVFVALLARDLVFGKRRLYAWTVPVLLGGAPSATYIIAFGLGGLLIRKTRKLGEELLIIGIVYFLFILAIHGNKAVSLQGHFGYLASANGHRPPGLTLFGLLIGIAAHPFNIVDAMWSKLPDVIANLAPSGLLGIFTPALMPLMVVVLLTNTLSFNVRFAEPIFQSLPIYVLMPVATVIVLAWILTRYRRTAIALAGLLAAQAVGWAVVWGPVTPTHWLRISGSTASTLASIEARIPTSAEVIVSQGIAGRFADRPHVYTLSFAHGVGKIPLHGLTWFVITPQEGIEIQTPASAMALIGELAGPLHGTLVTHANGVWAFVWTPPPQMQTFETPGNLSPLPAWTSPGVAGRAVMAGPETAWHVTSTGRRGYVADQLEWLAPPSRYEAYVTMSTTSAVNVEVWNDTGNVLLARRQVLPAGGIQTISLPVNATVPYKAGVYSGWGPFRAQFEQPAPGERIEVRIWSPGNTLVDVYNADLTPTSPSVGGS